MNIIKHIFRKDWAVEAMVRKGRFGPEEGMSSMSQISQHIQDSGEGEIKLTDEKDLSAQVYSRDEQDKEMENLEKCMAVAQAAGQAADLSFDKINEEINNKKILTPT